MDWLWFRGCSVRSGASPGSRGVGCHESPGVVLHTVDPVRVGGQCPDTGLPLKRLGQPQAELAGAAATTARRAFGLPADRDGGLAAGEDHARLAEWLLTQCHRAR